MRLSRGRLCAAGGLTLLISGVSNIIFLGPHRFLNSSTDRLDLVEVAGPVSSDLPILASSIDSPLVEKRVKHSTSQKDAYTLPPKKAKKSHKRSSSKPKVKIHFLFVLYTELANIPLWDWFFKQAPEGCCSAWAICKHRSDCVKSGVDDIPWVTLIDSVKSEYCTDVVSPEHALFEAALNDISASEGKKHKFVLLCGHSLPVRPWSELYAALTMRTESDFCFSRPRWWPTRAYEMHGKKLIASKKSSPDQFAWLAKHSQFVVLNYADARDFVDRWENSHEGLDLPRFRVRFRHWGSKYVFFPDTSFWFPSAKMNLCPDEYAIFGVVFGAFTPLSFGKSCPLNVKQPCNNETTLYQQRRCPVLNVKNHSILVSINQSDSRVQFSSTRGAKVVSLGPKSLQILRASSFIFVRKVVNEAVPLNTYVEGMRD
eukprot:TRINITY_DN11614_c0_g1_i1.p1 TRINITY_DN11614_c0_g1~~TRINITY_DN11614_c0_g1_i1.p1  ORF type:complete len:428 (-),score=42.77 TRINITY_DN11614_c0_g1_i1:171-1454(-)